MRKWAYPLLIAFVAFFIFSNPGRAGSQGREFVEWVGDLTGAVGEFLDGVFDDDRAVENNNNLTPDRNDGQPRSDTPDGDRSPNTGEDFFDTNT